MNAGGVPNTCKSNGVLKECDFGQMTFELSGGRYRMIQREKEQSALRWPRVRLANSYGRQQWGILHNGGNPDAATPRGGRRSSDCKLLLLRKIMTVLNKEVTANYVPAAAVKQVGGIPGVAVECVDIGRNTSGEGGLLGTN
ncbi:hypothetical protein TTRE_0000963301 [Trichuris trichiura]|uniref:Uncharacterized protein n=1 Tax=Trichuris trichiura TaxID=36087 RepID=A0A077ZLH5_TRITR|nr:hypothetical protein TTRE_0000963301 [Trichuris trichiura]